MSRFKELVKTANVMSVTGGLKMITRFNTIPKPGQVLLYIDFSSLTTRSIADALILLKEMGYKPDLRYSQAENESIKLYAVLKDEQFNSEMPRDYLSDEWEKLVEAFLPDDMAVRTPRSSPRLAVAA
jgi:hypothetical protein